VGYGLLSALVSQNLITLKMSPFATGDIFATTQGERVVFFKNLLRSFAAPAVP
jgi:hypothetical protein